MAILLPVAAQTLLAFVSALVLFRNNGWQSFKASNLVAIGQPEIATFMRQLGQTFLVVWLLQLGLVSIESLGLCGATHPLMKVLGVHLKFLLKTAGYGYFIIQAMLYLGTRWQQKTHKPFQVHMPSLLGYTAVYLFYMIGQRYFGWDLIHGLHAKLDQDRFAYDVYRASGFMGHPLTLAYNATIFALISLGQGLWLLARQKQLAGFWLLESALLFMIVLLTGSRFPAIVLMALLVVGAGLYFWQFRTLLKTRHVFSAFVLFVFVFAFMAMDPNLRGRLTEMWEPSLPIEQRFDRLVFWKVHLQMGLDAPFSGVGLLAYKETLLRYYNEMGFADFQRKYNAHNMYLQAWAEFGFFGLLSLLIWLVGICRCGLGIWKAQRNMSLLLLALGTVIGASMQNTLRDSENLYCLWFGMGLVLLALNFQDRSKDRQHQGEL